MAARAFRGWSYDDVQEAPAWWLERALLYLSVEAAWQEHESERYAAEAKHR